MAENEINIKEEEIFGVGSENQIKVEEGNPNEMRTQEQKAAAEGKPEDEGNEKEASIENNPNEDSVTKSNRWKFEPVKDQDISQYLWDTLLRGFNNLNEWSYNKFMDALDRGLSKGECGPAKPEASKKEKTEHTKERGANLYSAKDSVISGEGFQNLREAVVSNFTDDMIAATCGAKTNEERQNISSEERKAAKQFVESKYANQIEGLKSVTVRVNKIAYDMAVSEFLHEKMAKDKDFDFATMDKKALVKELQGRIMEKHERLMTGVMATFYYSSNIESLNSQETLNACEEYLGIRENESNAIKNLINKDLEAGNFVANGKNPNRDIGVKINAYNRSFDNDAMVMNSALKETATFLQNSNLTAEEKVNLAEFQKSINLAQKFEVSTVMNLQKQLKALAPAYQQCLQRRDNLKAFKERMGLKSLSPKTLQIHANNAIIQAIGKAKGGRR